MITNDEEDKVLLSEISDVINDTLQTTIEESLFTWYDTNGVSGKVDGEWIGISYLRNYAVIISTKSIDYSFTDPIMLLLEAFLSHTVPYLYPS